MSEQDPNELCVEQLEQTLEQKRAEAERILAKEEEWAVKRVLNAYYIPEATKDKGIGARAFIAELVEISADRPRFESLLKTAKTSAADMQELVQLALASFKRYLEGELEYLASTKQAE
jgi:hypothetical protein